MVPMMAAAAANPELTNKAISGVGKALKIVGIAVGAGLVGFVVYNVVKKAKDTKKANDDLKKNTEGINNENVHLDEATLNNMANSLYKSFDQDAFWFSSYNDKEIINTLSRLSNKDEWKALCLAFGTRAAKKDDGGKPHDLPWFLGSNNANHKADYQAILDKIGLPGILGRLK